MGVADGGLGVWVGAECSLYGGVGVGCHEFSSSLVVALLPADHGAVKDAADALHVNADEELHDFEYRVLELDSIQFCMKSLLG